MNLTNNEVWNAKEPLEKLMGERFPVKTAYELAKLASKLRDQYLVNEDVRNGLVSTYGQKNEVGQVAVETTSENFPKFLAELTELMDTEVEVVCSRVTLPEKVDEKTIAIEPSILLALEAFINVK